MDKANIKCNIPEPTEKGTLGVGYLKRYWALVQAKKKGKMSQLLQKEQPYIRGALGAVGVGLEPTMIFLIRENRSFEQFEQWIKNTGSLSKQHIALFNSLLESTKKSLKPENVVLSPKMMQHWEDHGYVVVPNAISKKQAQATADLLYSILEVDPDNPESWYNQKDIQQGIMVQMFAHPILQENRFNPKIKAAFEALWDRTDLMASCDRLSFNPPETKTFKFPGPHLHWDVSLKQPIPFSTQGLIYLTDTAANQGAFKLVPGFHKTIDKWLKELPKNENPRTMDLTNLGAKPIVANAGDLIIWHQALPHGADKNTHTKPRLVQYINYLPLDREIHEEWI